MLAIKARRAHRKRITNFQAFMPRACSVAPLLVASLTNFEHFGYTKPQRVYPLHTPREVQTSQGRRLHAQLRMAAPPCAAR